jgi:hypothetical protein
LFGLVFWFPRVGVFAWLGFLWSFVRLAFWGSFYLAVLFALFGAFSFSCGSWLFVGAWVALCVWLFFSELRVFVSGVCWSLCRVPAVSSARSGVVFLFWVR